MLADGQGLGQRGQFGRERVRHRKEQCLLQREVLGQGPRIGVRVADLLDAVGAHDDRDRAAPGCPGGASWTHRGRSRPPRHRTRARRRCRRWDRGRGCRPAASIRQSGRRHRGHGGPSHRCRRPAIAPAHGPPPASGRRPGRRSAARPGSLPHASVSPNRPGLCPGHRRASLTRPVARGPARPTSRRRLAGRPTTAVPEGSTQIRDGAARRWRLKVFAETTMV